MRRTLYLVMLATLLPGCKTCGQDEEEVVPMPSAPTATATPPATLPPVQRTPPQPFVKTQLDNRDDGISGTSIRPSGADAIVDIPKDADVVQVVLFNKARLAAASYAGSGSAAGLEQLTRVLGLAECQWQPTQDIAVGKDKLPAQVADGTCLGAAGQVYSAWMATANLLLLGSWEEDGDSDAIGGVMRSARKPGGKAGGPDDLLACCRALANNAQSAPLPQRGFMLQAASTCESAARSNDVTAVNAALKQFGMKCK